MIGGIERRRVRVFLLLALLLLFGVFLPLKLQHRDVVTAAQDVMPTLSLKHEVFSFGKNKPISTATANSDFCTNISPAVDLQTRTRPMPDCRPPLLPALDTIPKQHRSNSSSNICTKRTTSIPAIIHTTSRVRCMTPRYLKVFDQWRFTDHALVLYDDDNVQEYFQAHLYWSETFPQLKQAMNCLPEHNGASTADLWRYLVLWDQGGGYTDIDNAPGRDFTGLLDLQQQQQQQQQQQATMDAFIPINQRGRLTQSFIVASRQHPLIYLALSRAIDNLLQLTSLATQNASLITGPFALMDAFNQFKGGTPVDYNQHSPGIFRISKATEQLLQERFPGQTWMMNRTVTVVGSQQTPHIYVKTALKGPAKREYYQLVNMQKWQKVGKQHQWAGSCKRWLDHHRSQQEQR